MNKRIREVVRKLEEQAYVEHRQEYFCDNDDPTITSVSVTRHFDREKFAELIVRECMENFTKVWYEQGVDVRGADIHKFMKRFEEHFGVD